MAGKKKETDIVAVDESMERLPAEDLISQAIDKNVPVETMEKLLAMRQQLRAEMAQEAFVRAMSGFQADCPVIKKTKVVRDKYDKIRYRFAPIDSIVSQVKEALAKHDLSYTITTHCEPDGVISTCHVRHVMGHTEKSSIRVPIDQDAYMNIAQKVASASTFSKRYAFCNALGIMTGDEDDDAVNVGDAGPGNSKPLIRCVRCRKKYISEAKAEMAKDECGYRVCGDCLKAYREKKKAEAGKKEVIDAEVVGKVDEAAEKKPGDWMARIALCETPDEARKVLEDIQVDDTLTKTKVTVLTTMVKSKISQLSGADPDGNE